MDTRLADLGVTFTLGASVPFNMLVKAATRPWTNALRMPLD